MKEEIARNVRKAVGAGLAIGIGGTAYLATGYAILFPIGLLIVCLFGLNLFTGKVGYMTADDVFGIYSPVRGKELSLSRLGLMLVVNLVTAYIFGIIIGACNPGAGGLSEIARTLTHKKIYGDAVRCLIYSALCGAMVFIAVDSYKHCKDSISGIVILWIATAIFVYCGFEHCIANAFYFGASHAFGEILGMLKVLVVNVMGNAIGAIGCRCLFGIIF